MPYDTAVIGAGVSGMTCAALLARAGRRVALIERDTCTGPLLRGYDRGGMHVELGLHCLGDAGSGGITDVLLHAAGVRAALELIPYEADDGDWVWDRRDDRVLRLPTTWPRLQQAMQAAFPADAAGVEHYVATCRQLYEDHVWGALSGELESVAMAWRERHGKVAEFLAQHIDAPALRWALLARGVTAGVSPADAPMVAHATVTGSFHAATAKVRGGGRALADAFAGHLDELGVDLVLGTSVENVLATADGHVCGVRLDDGQVIEAGSCIFTGDARGLPALLPDGALRPAYCKRLRRLRNSYSAMLVGALSDRELPALHAANLFWHTSPTDSIPAVRLPLHDRPMTAIANPVRTTDGQTPLTVICPVCLDDVPGAGADHAAGRRPPAYDEWKTRFVETVQACLQACPAMNFGNVTVVDCATPLTFRDYMRTPQGCIYGVRYGVEEPLLSSRTRMPGMFLAGQSLFGPGILGALLAAAVTCTKLVGRGTIDELMRNR